jgi:hypothetical protein
VTGAFEEGTSGCSISVHYYTFLSKQICHNPVHYTSGLKMEADNGHEMSKFYLNVASNEA